MSANNAGDGFQAPTDNEYVSRTGQKDIVPVVNDNNAEDAIDDKTADSDATLERDEADAIDEDNIMDSRTRGAAKSSGTYRDPGAEEGLPADDGTSRGAQ